MSEKHLSKEEVLKIAKLARLKLTQNEVEVMGARLAKVLGYVEELSELTTAKTLEPHHVPQDAKPLREDRAQQFENLKGLLDNAPALEDNCFKLPAVLEES